MNKFVGIAMIVSVGLAVLAAVVEYEAPMAAEMIYMLSGLGLIAFGIWGGILLIKNK